MSETTQATAETLALTASLVQARDALAKAAQAAKEAEKNANTLSLAERALAVNGFAEQKKAVQEAENALRRHADASKIAADEAEKSAEAAAAAAKKQTAETKRAQSETTSAINQAFETTVLGNYFRQLKGISSAFEAFGDKTSDGNTKAKALVGGLAGVAGVAGEVIDAFRQLGTQARESGIAIDHHRMAVVALNDGYHDAARAAGELVSAETALTAKNQLLDAGLELTGEGLRKVTDWARTYSQLKGITESQALSLATQAAKGNEEALARLGVSASLATTEAGRLVDVTQRIVTVPLAANAAETAAAADRNTEAWKNSAIAYLQTDALMRTIFEHFGVQTEAQKQARTASVALAEQQLAENRAREERITLTRAEEAETARMNEATTNERRNLSQAASALRVYNNLVAGFGQDAQGAATPAEALANRLHRLQVEVMGVTEHRNAVKETAAAIRELVTLGEAHGGVSAATGARMQTANRGGGGGGGPSRSELLRGELEALDKLYNRTLDLTTIERLRGRQLQTYLQQQVDSFDISRHHLALERDRGENLAHYYERQTHYIERLAELEHQRTALAIADANARSAAARQAFESTLQSVTAVYNQVDAAERNIDVLKQAAETQRFYTEALANNTIGLGEAYAQYRATGDEIKQLALLQTDASREEIAALQAKQNAIAQAINAQEALNVANEKSANFSLQMSAAVKEAFHTQTTAAQSAGESFKAVMGAMTGALTQHLVAVIQGKETFGQAMRGMAEDVLISIVQQAIPQVIFQTAAGIANLAVENYKGAALNFAAAGTYAVVAGAAGGVASAMYSADRASTALTSASGGSIGVEQQSSAPQGFAQPLGLGGSGGGSSGGTTIIYNYNGILSQESLENTLTRTLDSAGQRGRYPIATRRAMGA